MNDFNINQLIKNSLNSFFLLFVFVNTIQAQEDSIELIFQKGHSLPIEAMAQSPDGQVIVTGGKDLMLRFRDLRTGIEFKTYSSDRWKIGDDDTYISHIEYSKDGQYLLCQVNAHLYKHIVTIRLSDYKLMTESYQNGTYGTVRGGFFMPDGKSVVYCYSELKGEGYMKRYNLATGKTEKLSYYSRSSSTEYAVEHAISFSQGHFITPNKKYLLTIGSNYKIDGKDGELVFVVDLATMKTIKRINLPEIPDDFEFAIVPDQDNQHFYVIPSRGGEEHGVCWKKYNLLTGQLVNEIAYTYAKRGERVETEHSGTTKNGVFFYEDYRDTIKFVKLGEFKPFKTIHSKTAKGNTHIDQIDHLGRISDIISSVDGKSLFVAFEGRNKERKSDLRKDDVSDVFTIRQIDIATGRVLREYASLGKEVSDVFFHPNGRSMWMVESYSSHAYKNKDRGSTRYNYSTLNIWKFRDIGNFNYQEVYSEKIDEVVLSKNRDEYVLQDNNFKHAISLNPKDLSLSKIYIDDDKDDDGDEPERKFYLIKDRKKTRNYDLENNLRINTCYTKILDENYHVYNIEDYKFEKNTYLGQLIIPKMLERRISLAMFTNQGKEFAFLSEKYMKDADGNQMANRLYFYDLNSIKNISTINFKVSFEDDFPVYTNSTDGKWLAITPQMEEFMEKGERIKSPVLYIINALEHTVHKRIVLATCREGTRYNPSTGKKTTEIVFCPEQSIFSLEFSPRAPILFGGMFNHTIRKWDVNTGKILGQLKGHESVVSSMSIHPKKNIMVSGDKSGQLIFWNTDTWGVLAKMILVGKDDYLVYTPDGYYMATPNALDWVAFKKGDNFFRFEQFDVKYNRPDIVMDSLGLVSSSMIKMLKKAYDKRLEKLGLTEADLGQLHAPSLSIEQEIPFETKTTDFELDVKLEDTKEKLKQFNVYINDVPVYGLKGKSLLEANTQKITEKVKLKLSNGINNIVLSVTNQKGVESIKEHILLEYNEPANNLPDLHLVMIGVSNYGDASRNLTFAAKDANDIMNVFAQQQKHYTNIHTTILTNEQANTTAIVSALDQLKNSNVNDEVIIYFSGHGLLDKELNYYLATYETDFEAPQNTSLKYSKLEKLLSAIQARKKLVFIDACHSGEVDKTEVEFDEKDTSGIEAKEVTMRSKSGNGLVKPKLGLKNSFTYMRTLFSDISKGTGATIISAAGGMEFALESKDWNNSVFAYAVLRGIKWKKADLDGDGYIKISELQRYVKSTVYQMTNGKQVPTTRQVNRFGDFHIFRK